MPLPAKTAAGTAPAKAAAPKAATQDAPKNASPKKSSEILAELFHAGNECITAPNGIFPVKDDTRELLALFRDGRFLVSAEHKFDGRAEL